MITLEDFLQLAMDDFYRISIFNCETGEEVIHQAQVCEIEELLKIRGCEDLMYECISSWDIEDTTKDFTINI